METNSLRDEVQRLRNQCEKQAAELRNMEEKLEDAHHNLAMAQEDLNEAQNNEKK